MNGVCYNPSDFTGPAARLDCETWALNSAVECHLHTVEVTGSNPVAPTILLLLNSLPKGLSKERSDEGSTFPYL